MRIKILLSLWLLLQVVSVQSQPFHWATAATGIGYEYGTKATKDAAGNTYILGYFIGDSSNSSGGNTFEFNGVSYPANGRGDAFFAKLDSNKQLVWMKTIGGNDTSYFDEATDIHIDPFGDIYITFTAKGFNISYNSQILSGVGSIGQYGGRCVAQSEYQRRLFVARFRHCSQHLCRNNHRCHRKRLPNRLVS